MKRIILIIMTVILSMDILVGCSDKSYETNNIAGEEKATTAPVTKESIVEDNHFKITRTEFINKYDKLILELEDNTKPHLSPKLADARCEISTDVVAGFPNMSKRYVYDITVYSTEMYRLRRTAEIIVDENDNLIGVSINDFDELATDRDQYFLIISYTAANMAITGLTRDEALQAQLESSKKQGMVRKNGYEYGLVMPENSKLTAFVIQVIDE